MVRLQQEIGELASAILQKSQFHYGSITTKMI